MLWVVVLSHVVPAETGQPVEVQHLEHRALYRDHSTTANLVPKIKLAGAGRSGVTVKTDGEQIGSNSPDPSGFQAARAKSRRAICPWSIFRRSGRRFVVENATKQKAVAPRRTASLSFMDRRAA